jgi:putative DNA primase/helicase
MADLSEAEQFRADSVALMVSLMRGQRAPWQRADRADLPAPIMPYNGVDNARVFRSVNALLLISAMQAHGWTDPRFVSASQAQDAGWRIRGSGTSLIFWHELQGKGNPGTEIIRLFNAEEVVGMPALAPRPSAPEVDLTAFAQAVGGHNERARLLNSSALARRAAAQMLGPPAKGEEWRHALRAQLAGYFFAREAGDWYRPGPEPVSQLPVTTKLLDEPDEFFRAVRDAQAVAREIVPLARRVDVGVNQDQKLQEAAHAWTDKDHVQRVENPVVRGGSALGGKSGPPTVPTARTQGEDSGRVFLAVPFAELGKAKAAGAKWDAAYKVWWVRADSDRSKVEQWIPKSQSFDKSEVKESFAKAMKEHGLAYPIGGVEDDNRWHYVPTKDATGNKKQGAYILNTGGIPHGFIKNFKGSSGPWRYDGEGLSPEVRAAFEAQAKEQAILREQELRRQQQEIAGRSEGFFKALTDAGIAQHGYLKRKGVQGHGLFICKEAAQLQGLLNLPDFKSRGDAFLIVPGYDVDGNYSTAQAIAGREAGGKIFVAGARKKGAMHLIGAQNVEALARASAVLFAEGYATAAKIYEDMGRAIPIVVAFDAGNLVEVARDLAKRLPDEQVKLVCGDNDQFMVERALDKVRLVMPELPKIPVGGSVVQVQAGEGAGLREVPLGPILADGQWHQASKGKYRLSLDRRANVGVERVRVDVIERGSEKHMQLEYENKGRVSAEEAARILGGRAVVPAFASLEGRPTDFNDLGLREGPAAVCRIVQSGLGGSVAQAPLVVSGISTRAPVLTKATPAGMKR